jgi:hypothetical protein
VHLKLQWNRTLFIDRTLEFCKEVNSNGKNIAVLNDLKYKISREMTEILHLRNSYLITLGMNQKLKILLQKKKQMLKASMQKG